MEDGVVLATYRSAGWGSDTRTEIKGQVLQVPDLRQISDRMLHSGPAGANAKSRALPKELSTSQPFLAVLSRTPTSTTGWLYIDASQAVTGMLVIHRNEVYRRVKPEKAGQP